MACTAHTNDADNNDTHTNDADNYSHTNNADNYAHTDDAHIYAQLPSSFSSQQLCHTDVDIVYSYAKLPSSLDRPSMVLDPLEYVDVNSDLESTKGGRI